MKQEIDKLTTERAEREREASDASTKLEAAHAAYKNERSAGAFKALEAAQRESERATLALEGVTESLEKAQAAQAEGEREARQAAFEQARQAVSAGAFRGHVAPIAARLAELARETAALTAKGSELSATFTSQHTALASLARESGVNRGPVPPYAKIFGAEVALASGKSPPEVLALFFGTAPVRDDATAQLADAYEGEDPSEVKTLLAQLHEAEVRRAATVRKLLAEGSGQGSGASPNPLDSFRGVSGECARMRARLSGLGYQPVAEDVRIDPLARELVGVDVAKAATLIDRHREADHARDNDECTALQDKLAALGCPQVARALPRSKPKSKSQTAIQGPPVTIYR